MIRLYESRDEGSTWAELPAPVENTGTFSNPPCMRTMTDGRLCLAYGYRDAPSGIRAVIGADSGRSWGEEIVLRDDGGDFDVGYPKAVINRDGKVVIAYYFNTHTDSERFIGVTIWDAGLE